MEIIQDKFKKVADFCYDLFRLVELPLYSVSPRGILCGIGVFIEVDFSA